MNKIRNQYIREIKALFPLKLKSEKEYLKKLVVDIDDYCEDANVASKQDLYENYGTPAEVVSNYLTTFDTDVLIKRLRFSKAVRACAITLIVAVIVATGAFCLNQYLMKKAWEEHIVVASEETIIIKERTE